MADNTLGSGIAFPRNGIGRSLAVWADEVWQAARAKWRATATMAHPAPHGHDDYASRRAAYLESAAMRRELQRL